jgi:hypothetical protein
MMDLLMIERLVDGGLSAVCAWCEHFWRVFEQNLGREAHCGKDCGGPASHRAFPEYKGPMKGRFLEFCFICGKEASSGADINGKGCVGICEEHVSKFKQMLNSKKGSPPPIVKEREVLKLKIG